MRILPNLQNLLGLRAETQAKAQPIPAKAIPTTLSFVDQAAISVQGSEPIKRGIAATVRNQARQVARLVRRQPEQILQDARQAGASGRIARQQALRAVADLPASAVVATGSAKIRMIPAKAIDFGFGAHPARRRP